MDCNLNASRPLHSVSYGVSIQCLYCIAILVGFYYTSGVGGVESGASALGELIPGTGGRFFESVFKKKKRRRKHFIFYQLSISGF